MGSDGLAPRPDECPDFPLDLNAFRVRLAAGDEQPRAAFYVAARGPLGYLPRSSTDNRDLARGLDGLIVLSGQDVSDTHAAMDARMDGITMLNHHVESWYVPCSCESSFMLPCVAWWADGTFRSFWGAGGRQFRVLFVRSALSR